MSEVKTDKDIAWEKFILKFKDRIKEYEKANPFKKNGQIMLPATWNGKEWAWVSRKDRRSGRYTK